MELRQWSVLPVLVRLLALLLLNLVFPLPPGLPLLVEKDAQAEGPFYILDQIAMTRIVYFDQRSSSLVCKVQ